jgi:hypothetical protein
MLLSCQSREHTFYTCSCAGATLRIYALISQRQHFSKVRLWSLLFLLFLLTALFFPRRRPPHTFFTELICLFHDRSYLDTLIIQYI